MRPKFIPTKVNGLANSILVSTQSYEIRIIGHASLTLTVENARNLASILNDFADQIEDELAFDEKCQQILSALTPAQLKLLAEKLSTVKETPNET